MRVIQSAILVLSLSTTIIAAPQKKLAPDVPSAETMEAYRSYWQEFDRYEAHRLREEKDKYQRSWNQLRQEFDAKTQKLTSEQVTSLRKSIEKYKDNLKQYPDSDIRVATLLNLAQAQTKLAGVMDEAEEGAGQTLRMAAITNLTEIERGYPQYEKIDQVLYLHGLLLTHMGQDQAARTLWQKLSQMKKASLFTLHGNLAMGDFHFRQEKPREALTFYKKARDLLQNGDIPNRDYESLRVQYRVAWAAYRSARLGECIETAFALLGPGREARKRDFQKKVEQDAVDLIGDALFEKNEIQYTKSTLRRREIAPFAAAVATRVMQQYAFHKMYDRVIEIGEHVAEEHPLTRESPGLLAALAEGYQKTGQEDLWLVQMEKLALLLPKDSLWRSRHRDQFESTRQMESLSLPAAKTVAAWHYEKGIATGNATRLNNAQSYYGLLAKYDPVHQDAMQWRIRQANCAFYAGRYPEADARYAHLKSEMRLKDEDLAFVAYQLALTREKIWNDAFLKVSLQGEGTTTASKEALKNLQKAVEEYANRFPMESKTVDLLLMAASANRDADNLAQANQYWQRALVSDPTPGQRAIAIRGMVLTKVNKGTSRDVMDLAMRYLKLENWDSMGTSLGSELKGVLSSAAVSEGERLNKEGNVLESGGLLVMTAQEFPDIPERDKIYRDGAYMLALGGDWSGARHAALRFLDEGRKNDVAGDMLYLKARADEFQMKFRPAVESYLALANQYPRHSRVKASLVRAENLAGTDENYDMAGRAAEKLGDLAGDNDAQVKAYQRSYQHFEQGGDHGSSARVAAKMNKKSNSTSLRLQSQLAEARSQFALGNEKDALASFARIARAADKERDRLDPKIYQSVAGEAYFLLGQEAEAQFRDYKLTRRSGKPQDNVNRKAAYFETLSQHYDKAIRTGHEDFAIKSRLRVAAAAQEFSEDLAELLTKYQDKMASSDYEKLSANKDRLSSLAAKYKDANTLANSSTKGRNARGRSARNGRGNRAVQDNGDDSGSGKEVLPEAVGNNMPSQWSF